MRDDMKEHLIKSKKIYCGKAVAFSVDKVRLPNGRAAVREYLNHPGAVAVVAFSGHSRRSPQILLVRQYRHPVRRITWEIPAGKLDPKESPAVCARRELEEETGFKAGRLRHLISYWPTAAFSDETIHIFGAWDLTRGVFKPDDDEFINSRPVDFKTALRWVKRGKIKDSKTIIALLFVANGFCHPLRPHP
jgi:ADP-ribose pyrophosphatase